MKTTSRAGKGRALLGPSRPEVGRAAPIGALPTTSWARPYSAGPLVLEIGGAGVEESSWWSSRREKRT